MFNISNIMYKIRYTYLTGNSFGSHKETDELPYEFSNLEDVKNAVHRIQEHYAWYKENNNRYSPNNPPTPPAWWDCKYPDPWTMIYLINFEIDGKHIQLSPPWCGYFESLLSVEVVLNLPTITF